jgi:hypothetical protein
VLLRGGLDAWIAGFASPMSGLNLRANLEIQKAMVVVVGDVIVGIPFFHLKHNFPIDKVERSGVQSSAPEIDRFFPA